ncbi:MAG: GGDEF domain-containing protein [Haliea sp.]|nr:GGDEF domain-containing protein [Haliea sp.]|tara:strand:+ start:33 stop:1889 length:1857 start_codon:yes stop_codon:yes gene_type:complete
MAINKTIRGSAQGCEIEFKNVTGQLRQYECTLVPIVTNNEVQGLYAVVKDVTERNIGYESQRLLKESLESSDDAVLVVDVRKSNLPVVFVNTAFSKLIGERSNEVLHASFNNLVGLLEDEDEAQTIKSALADARATSLTIRSHRKDGSIFWNQVSLSPVRDESGVVTHFTAIMKDISDKREQELTLAYQATHDALTGLGNRALLEDRLEHDIAIAQRNASHLAVLFIDLDEFKPINDTLGHRIGDEVLVSVARKLEAVIRPTDTLARFGGDEFVLLLPNIQSRHEAQEVADRILEAIGQPHHVGSHELYVTASIGISMLGEDLDFANKLIQQADMAMYKAKQQGRDTYEVFSNDLDTVLSKRVTLRNELQEAIRDGQLYLNYQPQVDQNGRVCGLEALVRWNHPQKGLVPPNEFIPVAEETGQIIHLGRWVANKACKDAAVLLELGLLRGRVAVNLSPLQFHRPGFLGSLKVLMEQTGLPGHHLELEITEGILMRNTEAAIEILEDLRALEIATSIDDFGTGFSSFSYLKDLPVEAVKIDRSFVDNVTTSQKDAAVCQGVLTMARAMGTRVIAEGVETREQFEQLKTYGCQAFQGYYFAKPMGFDDLVGWLRLNLVVD